MLIKRLLHYKGHIAVVSNLLNLLLDTLANKQQLAFLNIRRMLKVCHLYRHQFIWEKNQRKHSFREGNSSLSFIEAVCQRYWRMPHPWRALAHERKSMFKCKQRPMIPENQDTITTHLSNHHMHVYAMRWGLIRSV